MRVLVTGGTGTLGGEFVKAAIDDGYTVRIMSRRLRPEDSFDKVEWVQADLTTGEGLADAVRDVQVIVHGATSPAAAKKVDVEGTRYLLQVSDAAGIHHFIYPSIVGIDDIPFSYYKHKRSAEHLVETASTPHTILRATQFHEFVDEIIATAMRLPLAILLPTQFQVQSVAASEVAGRICELIGEGASGRLPNFGGPEITRLEEMAGDWMKARGRHKRIIRLPVPGKTARAFRDGKNTDPLRKEGRITWREWLDEVRQEAA